MSCRKRHLFVTIVPQETFTPFPPRPPHSSIWCIRDRLAMLRYVLMLVWVQIYISSLKKNNFPGYNILFNTPRHSFKAFYSRSFAFGSHHLVHTIKRSVISAHPKQVKPCLGDAPQNLFSNNLNHYPFNPKSPFYHLQAILLKFRCFHPPASTSYS